MSQDAPSNAGELVGERDGFDPRLEPIALPMLWPDPDQHDPGRLDEQGAQIAIAKYELRRMFSPKRQTIGCLVFQVSSCSS